MIARNGAEKFIDWIDRMQCAQRLPHGLRAID
jgi:hypothetical protein